MIFTRAEMVDSEIQEDPLILLVRLDDKYSPLMRRFVVAIPFEYFESAGIAGKNGFVYQDPESVIASSGKRAIRNYLEWKYPGEENYKNISEVLEEGGLERFVIEIVGLNAPKGFDISDEAFDKREKDLATRLSGIYGKKSKEDLGTFLKIASKIYSGIRVKAIKRDFTGF